MPLYFVEFDKQNNPKNAKAVPLLSGKGPGQSHWNKQTNFTKSVYVEAPNKLDAIEKAKVMAANRLERNS